MPRFPNTSCVFATCKSCEFSRRKFRCPADDSAVRADGSETGQKKPLQQIRLYSNDVERSRACVLRLVFCNWLAQMDRPVASEPRSRPRSRQPTGRTRPPWAASRALSPEDLDRVIDHTLYARQIFRPEGSGFMGGGMSASASRLGGDGLLALGGAQVPRPADRCCRIVPGASMASSRCRPARRGVFKSLPEEIAPDEPIPAAEK